MTDVTQAEFTFPVTYAEGTQTLRGTIYRPASSVAGAEALPPVVFNSGFTGGVSMYGQLMGRALAERGYTVTTYDVTGFFTNKAVRNTYRDGDLTVTNVSLEDQTTELLALIAWTRAECGRMPAVASWAMGSVASLAAITELARSGGEQVAFYVPMNYTRLSALQGLRADPAAADAALAALADDAAIPPFDTGTEATRLGYYPLDPATQAYVDDQLGSYTDAGGADRWPGCTHVSAKSYKSYVAFDPEAGLAAAGAGFPPALIIHGAENTLHMPAESVRLHEAYPGEKGDAALILDGMAHGQTMQPDSPVFQQMIAAIDGKIRARCA
ncbi:alpha/beta hydrolase [Limimaricola pyoseonensis]|uniref:Pimeloyl-ACP methyl ester carboxylesterase n=1 Tax=Limimaricola pyoseonensis TaxID=521013 RepID=A0A1G7G6B4_9RHOB|nr:alpha/beta hydrolase [Limimaricola pyoseonensis]SDE83647.1 Pimeloyl-ACP methyl ester carboxylesterase [Limimaricola pyoseonensis]